MEELREILRGTNCSQRDQLKRFEDLQAQLRIQQHELIDLIRSSQETNSKQQIIEHENKAIYTLDMLLEKSIDAIRQLSESKITEPSWTFSRWEVVILSFTSGPAVAALFTRRNPPPNLAFSGRVPSIEKTHASDVKEKALPASNYYYWRTCCQCGNGPSVLQLAPACVCCDHETCGYCLMEELWPSGLAVSKTPSIEESDVFSSGEKDSSAVNADLVWTCCSGAFGEMAEVICPRCIMCSHDRCTDCTVKFPNPELDLGFLFFLND
jgi:hypothetical protein